MLTEELLKAQTNLAHLTDEDRKAIREISERDEAKVIGDKLAETWNKLDETIEKASGVKRPSNEKTYDFTARLITELKQKGGDDVKAELEKLREEKSDLEKQIKAGSGDQSLKKQLTELEKELQDKKTQIKQLKDKYDTDIATKDADIEKAQKDAISVKIDYQFEHALAGLKFKSDAQIPKEVREAYIATAKQAILAELTPDFVDDGKGGKQLVFRKGTEIQLNRENGLQPVSASDLLAKQLAPIIDTGRQATGTGTKPAAAGMGNVNAGGTFRVDAKTQIEATEQIGKYLTDNGIARGTSEFMDKLRDIGAENKVSELPFK